MDKKIISAIAEQLSVSPNELTLETKQGDITSWDSVGHVNMLMNLSGQFGKMIDPGKVQDLVTIKALVEYFSES